MRGGEGGEREEVGAAARVAPPRSPSTPLPPHLRRLVATAREESRQLEDDAALHDASARAAAPASGRRALDAALARLDARTRADTDAADALREDVMRVLRGTEAAVRGFQRSEAWRTAARAAGAGAPLPPAARDALAAPADLPSRYLVQAVARLAADAGAATPLVSDLERLLAVDGAPDGTLATAYGGLPDALASAHDALLAVAARVDRVHTRAAAARDAHVATLRGMGDVRDPFRAAAAAAAADRGPAPAAAAPAPAPGALLFGGAPAVGAPAAALLFGRR